MLFTGSPTDKCPISLLQAKDIENPVGFDSRHAFECDDLLEWITVHNATNPITTERLDGKLSDKIHPLVVEGCDGHIEETQNKINRADMAMLEVT